ncbi:MAG: EF-hand domain-containing protein, partial [Verrucomicrobiota bacterium]
AHAVAMAKERAKQSFTHVDGNDDGSLSKEEVGKAMERFSQQRRSPQGGPDGMAGKGKSKGGKSKGKGKGKGKGDAPGGTTEPVTPKRPEIEADV